jgi:hypothetical protein
MLLQDLLSEVPQELDEKLLLAGWGQIKYEKEKREVWYPGHRIKKKSRLISLRNLMKTCFWQAGDRSSMRKKSAKYEASRLSHCKLIKIIKAVCQPISFGRMERCQVWQT